MAPLGHQHQHHLAELSSRPAAFLHHPRSSSSSRHTSAAMTVLGTPLAAPSLFAHHHHYNHNHHHHHPSSHDFSPSSSLMSAVQSDHDYVLKEKVQNMEENMAVTKVVQVTSLARCSGDTLLSSSAPLDLDSLMNDIDFSDDLADLNLGLSDLEASAEFPMEESFEDFIDSALDKSFSPGQWDVEEATARERADKDDFMRALGLQPSAHPNATNSSRDIASASSRQISETSLAAAGESCSGPAVVAAIPTKECTCAQHSVGSRAVYTTAGLRSPNVLSSSSRSPQLHLPPHLPAAIPPPGGLSPELTPGRPSSVLGPCLNCIQNRDVLEEFSKPLTIDVSSGADDLGAFQGLLPHVQQNIFQFGATINNNNNNNNINNRVFEFDQQRCPPQVVDSDTDDLLLWLSSNAAALSQDSERIPSAEKIPSGQFASHPYSNASAQNLDMESYMDLEDFLNNEESNPNSSCPQPTVQHDHTYQKSDSGDTLKNDNADTMDDDKEAQLRLSFPSDLVGGGLDKSAQLSKQCQDMESFSSSSSSWSSSSSSPSSSPLSSPYMSPHSVRSPQNDTFSDSEKNHLDILNFFSDDFASSVLNAGSPISQLRFM